MRPGIELGSIALLSPVRATTRLREELGVSKVGLRLVHSWNIDTQDVWQPHPPGPYPTLGGCCCDTGVGG